MQARSKTVLQTVPSTVFSIPLSQGIRLICLKTAVVSVLMKWMFVTEWRESDGMMKGQFQNFKRAW